MKKGIGYLRVSTIEQANDGISMEVQEDKIIKYCDLHDIQLVDMFKDAGLSGKDTNRPGFQAMMDYIEVNEVDYVVIYRISRFARNNRDLLNTVEEIKSHNTEIVFMEDNIDTSNTTSSFLMQILGAVAEMERTQTLDNSYYSMLKKSKNGGWNGGKVYGYKADEGLFINKEEAEVVREIFDLYANKHYGLKKIAIHLNNRGIKTNRGNLWCSATLSKMLDNPVYIGKVRWTIRVGDDSSEQMINDGIHKPIIDIKLWNDTVARRNLKRTQPNPYKGTVLLGGLVKCPVCGSSMHGSKLKNGKPYYRCIRNNTYGAKVCNPDGLTTSVNATKLENKVMAEIKRYINHPNTMKAVMKKLNEDLFGDNKKSLNQLEARKRELQGKLKKINDEQRVIYNKKLEGEIDFEMLTGYIRKISKDEAVINEQLKFISEDVEKLKIEIDMDKVVEVFANKLDNVFDASPALQKRLFRSVIMEIRINPGDTIDDRQYKEMLLYFEPEEILALSNFKPEIVAYITTTAPRYRWLGNTDYIVIRV